MYTISVFAFKSQAHTHTHTHMCQASLRDKDHDLFLENQRLAQRLAVMQSDFEQIQRRSGSVGDFPIRLEVMPRYHDSHVCLLVCVCVSYFIYIYIHTYIYIYICMYLIFRAVLRDNVCMYV